VLEAALAECPESGAGNELRPVGPASFPEPLSCHDQARALGAKWATDVQSALRSENRRAAGGWPGTMREAHVRAAWLVSRSQSAHLPWPLPQATADLAKAVYASARARWLAHSEEEDDDGWDAKSKTTAE
jgi:hypothetical protein